MAAERRPLTIYYRKLVAANGKELPLSFEKAIKSAISEEMDGIQLKSRWSLRCLTDTDQAMDHLFMNQIHDDQNLIFGNMVSFTKGRAQALLRNFGYIPEVNIEQFDPPENDEFVDAILYWLVINDHVFLIQSPALRSNEFERYSRWLLTERTTIWPTEEHTFLIDQFDMSSDLPKMVPDIRSISIGGRARAMDALIAGETRTSPHPAGRTRGTDRLRGGRMG